MRSVSFLVPLCLGILAAPLAAQLALPQVRVPPTGTVLDPAVEAVARQTEALGRDLSRSAARLAVLRLARLDRLVRQNRDAIEVDRDGNPARRGELLVMQASQQELSGALAAGYILLARETIPELQIELIRLGVPNELALSKAEEKLRKLMPQATIAADTLHFTSGVEANRVSRNQLKSRLAPAAQAKITTPIGIIDGAPGAALPVEAVRGFAAGAPKAGDHGSAIVSLLAFGGATDVRVADVYGQDRAGGNALAIAKGLGWLVGSGSRIISISLVGPRNPVVEKAIASAQAKGVIVIAAVGNDGPAAPPAYPASYQGVLSVTAVDKRNRALIEAGRALHLDYAAPGADIYGRNAANQRIKLRGTSFAAPLVAISTARALQSGGDWRTQLDREARDLGEKGIDPLYGRGLLCGECRPQ